MAETFDELKFWSAKNEKKLLKSRFLVWHFIG